MKTEPENAPSREIHKPVKYSRVPFPQFTDRQVVSKTDNMRQLQRVKVEVTVELAQTRMSLEGLLGLRPVPEGVNLNDPNMTEADRRQYIVKLNKQIGESVDLLINGRIFAKGEVISTDPGDHYAVRIISILSDEERVEQQSARHER